MCLSLLLFDICCGLKAPFSQGDASHSADAGLYQKQRIHGWNGRNTFWSLPLPDGWEGRWTLRGIYVILLWCEILGAVASVNLCIAPKQKWLCRCSNPQKLKAIVEWVVMFLETWKGLWDMHPWPSAPAGREYGAHTSTNYIASISCFTCMKCVSRQILRPITLYTFLPAFTPNQEQA